MPSSREKKCSVLFSPSSSFQVLPQKNFWHKLSPWKITTEYIKFERVFSNRDQERGAQDSMQQNNQINILKWGQSGVDSESRKQVEREHSKEAGSSRKTFVKKYGGKFST